MVGADEARARATLVEMQTRISLGPHAVLDVEPNATPEEIRAAFLALTKTFHPARFGRMSPEIQKLSNEVFLGIKGAHETLLRLLGVPIRAPAAHGSGSFPRSASPPPERTTQRMPALSPAPRPLTPAFGVKIGGRPTTPPNLPPSPPPNPPTQPPGQPIPDERLELQRALELMTARNWSAARQAVTLLMARTQPPPKQYRALLCYTRGREAQEAGKNADAVMEMQRALQFDPDLGQAKAALAELLRRR